MTGVFFDVGIRVSCQHPPIVFDPFSHRRRQPFLSGTQVIGHLQVHPEFRRAVKRVVGTLEEWWGYTTKAAHRIRWLERKALGQSKLSLDEQKDLVVFMEALTGQLAPEATTPPMPKYKSKRSRVRRQTKRRAVSV
jgi:hypothetical protein